ncbi:unnamed protein product [Prunus armeniaca]
MGVIQDTTYVIALGLGFDRDENDYKVVKLVRFAKNGSVYEAEIVVEIYTLRLYAWRRISAVPSVSYGAHVTFLDNKCAFLNGVVYWIAKQNTSGQPECTLFILAFDLGSEEFKRIMVPSHQVPTGYPKSHVRVLEKSLSSFHLRHEQLNYFCDIWVLEMDTWKMTRWILLTKGDL